MGGSYLFVVALMVSLYVPNACRYSTDADLNERKKFHVDPSIVGSVGDQSSVQIKQKRPRGRSHGLLETDLCDPHQERRSQPRLEPAPAPGPEPEPEPEPELMARSQMNPLGGAADAAESRADA